ncbi:MAG: HupE/UreJ family protein [Pseudomonadota bacterium]
MRWPATQQHRFARRCIQALAFGVLLAPSALAHFEINLQLNLLVFHTEHRADGLYVYARVPLPYLLADKIGAEGSDGLPAPAPFTRNTLEGDRVVHYVDYDSLRGNEKRLGGLLEQALQLRVDADRIEGTVMSARVVRSKTAPPFDSLEEARASFAASDPMKSPSAEPLYVGDAVADIALRYFKQQGGTQQDIQRFSLSTSLNPGLIEQATAVSLVLDHGTGGTDLYQRPGLLNEPVEIHRSGLRAFLEMVRQGIEHILEGLDHVFLVLCLAAGAVSIAAMLWRVTGFTLGHSVTLSLGFFGYVPSGGWFIPTVEIAIAASIVFAAFASNSRWRSAPGANLRAFWMTAVIGLLHGLGFSFVLQKILSVSAPDVWQSLLAFNLGIEAGQLGIVVFVGAVLLVLRDWNSRSEAYARNAIAVVCGIAGVYWMIERTAGLIA